MNIKTIPFFLIALVLITDQLSKWYVLEFIIRQDGFPMPFTEWLSFDERLPFYGVQITSFFNIVMVWNEGISFGLFSGFGGTQWPLTILSLAIVGFLFIWMFRSNSLFINLVLGLIIGGALGNIWDRIRFGAVADFLDFHAFGYHWPAFNVADSAITAGVVILLIHNIFSKN